MSVVIGGGLGAENIVEHRRYDAAVAYSNDAVSGVLRNDVVDGQTYPRNKLLPGQSSYEIGKLAIGEWSRFFARHVAGLTEIKLRDAVHDRGFQAQGCLEGSGCLDRSELGTYVHRVEPLLGEVVRQRGGLSIAEIGECRIGSAGVVVDAFRASVSHEDEFHEVLTVVLGRYEADVV